MRSTHATEFPELLQLTDQALGSTLAVQSVLFTAPSRTRSRKPGTGLVHVNTCGQAPTAKPI